MRDEHRKTAPSDQRSETADARLVRRQRDLAVALNGTTDLREALHRCLGVAIEVSGMDSGGVYLRDPARGVWTLEASVGLDHAFIEAVAECAPPRWRSDALGRGDLVHVEQGAAPPDLAAAMKAEGLLVVAAVPVRHAGQVMASVNVASHSSPRIAEAERAALESTAAQVGAAIARIRDETEREAAVRRVVARASALAELRGELEAVRVLVGAFCGVTARPLRAARAARVALIDALLERAIASCGALEGAPEGPPAFAFGEIADEAAPR